VCCSSRESAQHLVREERKKERKKENKPTTAEIKQDKLCKIKSVAEIYLYDSAS